MGTRHKKQVVPERDTLSDHIGKYVRDIQGQKVAPDLLESIMKASDPVKEELRLILFELNQFRHKITKIKVCTFEMSGKITDSANAASETVISTPPHASAAPFSNIWPR